MILPAKTIQIKQLNPKLWDPFFFNYRVCKESSKFWLKLVPTIEGKPPRSARSARREEPRAVRRATFSYGRTKFVLLYCSDVNGLRSLVILFLK